MTGRSKAGRLPGSKVTGRRAVHGSRGAADAYGRPRTAGVVQSGHQ